MSRWAGLVALEGVATSDGRRILPDALTWETPLPLLRYVGDNGGAATVGSVAAIVRVGEKITASGDILADVAEGEPLAILVDRDDLTRDDSADPLVVQAARIRAVYVGGSPSAWPECKVLEVSL